MSLTTIVWTACNALLIPVDTVGNSDNILYFEIINKLAFSLATLSLLLIYYFSFYYPIEKKVKIINTILIAFAMLTAVFAPFSAISGKFLVSDTKLTYTPGSLSFLIGLVAFFIVVSGFFENVKILRYTKNDKLRRQAATLLIGLFLTIIHAIAFLIVLPVIFGDNPLYYAIGYVAPFYFVIFTLHGLLKQGLFDIRLIVARTAAYILSLGSIAVTISFLLFVVSGQFSNLGIGEDVLRGFYVIVTIALAVSYLPIKKLFDKVTNKLFYRDAYETQDLLNDFNQAIVTTIDLEKLLDKAAKVIEKYLHPEFSAFALIDSKNGTIRLLHNGGTKLSVELMEQIRSYVKKGDKVVNTDLLEDEQKDLKSLMQQAEGALLVRITKTTNTEGIGYMMLGYKKTGSVYNSQDIAAIEIIANELAIATENALRFEEIQNFAKTLQDKVDEATRNLRKANERLKELDQTKDDFISMASHQLRTPLTSVKGYVSMVLEGDAGKVSTKQKELLDQAFLSSQRMVYLIADLLNISRLKTGKFVIEAKETNLADVVEGEIAQLTETAKAKDLKLTYQKPKTFPSLMLDETKIRQVIMNFADNAVHYTPAGGNIQVELADKGDSVEFTVTDDGIGVPKAEQHHMFNKFYRAGNAKKARPDGTGLGLFMAKKVIVAQGGSIIFKSTEGKGSTFGFSFAKKPLSPENYKGPMPDKKLAQ